jgi:hypothetical protein
MWSAVEACLGAMAPVDGVALWGDFGELTSDCKRFVRNAVGGRFPDGVVVWGIEWRQGLEALCLENVEDASAPTAESLQRLADRFSLVLVHWCRCEAYAPGGVVVPYADGNPWDPRK